MGFGSALDGARLDASWPVTDLMSGNGLVGIIDVSSFFGRKEDRHRVFLLMSIIDLAWVIWVRIR